MKISKNDLCNSCLHMDLKFSSGEKTFSTISQFLDDPATTTLSAMGPALISQWIYMWLVGRGGCFSCIKRAMDITEGLPGSDGFIKTANESLKKDLESEARLKEFHVFIETGQLPSQPKVEVGSDIGLQSAMKRGYLSLEDGDWHRADAYFERALDIDPQYAPAYIGKLCVELKYNDEIHLVKYKTSLENMRNFQKALRFANDDYRIIIEGYNSTIKSRIEEETRKRAAMKAEATLKIEEEARNKALEDERQKAEAKKILPEIRERISKYRGYVVAANNHTVGLKRNGTVVASGCTGSADTYGFSQHNGPCSTGAWRNIIAIATSWWHTVGLCADGTVVATGKNEDGQCNTRDWRDIIAISANSHHTVGLKSNGTVVAVGCEGKRYNLITEERESTDKGQCNTGSWQNIIAIATGTYHTVGLKSDGTVITVGDNKQGQFDMNDWRGIVNIFASYSKTVGLKLDGTVVIASGNDDVKKEISNWRNIVSIATDGSYILGLKSDGTVLSAGSNWKDVKLKTDNWQDIVAVDIGNDCAFGLMSNGTVVTTGRNHEGQCNIGGWRDIGPPSQELVMQRKRWGEQGLCRLCGGQFSGLFTKKCKSCGNPQR